MREAQQQEPHRDSRVGRNVVTWGLAGATAGLVLGILIGFALATPGRFGFWMSVVGSTIFLGAVCAFTAGIASLDAPPPGEEPSDAPAAPDES
jgi:FtsH-binding integral membrane protein